MYILDKSSKKLKEINKTTFSEQSLKERYDLQEWIDNNPKILWDALGEEILIIQKEFSDFDKTKERLDLLAIDKNGNLVLIENKLDDSGRDVTWQALKYASYCSSFNKEQIIQIYQEYLNKKYPNQNKNASEEFREFFELEFQDIPLNSGFNQRIILISREFRPEVTSAVLWLRRKNIDIQCVKFVPYQLDDNRIIIDIDKIIPIPETEEYMIKMSQKEIEETAISSNRNKRQEIYAEYWDKLLEYCKKEKLDLYQNRTTSKDSWISAGSGISAIQYNFVIGVSSARVELYINRKEQEENKRFFDLLVQDKEDIEKELDLELSWERLDDKKASRISITNNEIFELHEKNSWNESIKWQIATMKIFEATFKKKIFEISNKFISK
ncbi:DUF4268 domain-containing protein [Actinobacillus equuli subsp. equuli]|uniref:DUF4268 domain-containing protein n=1 Tax=Actinobacillus equuli TaxID=718 RepID=UPI002441CF68|nr:DUF4268 domain-containing protein [Actinobacillus equuli]WGE50667.1 DUF4268 domain-containing protein [Actinobacillus equuli subsp. haemolyticus]WGE54955.1 DUF4268 domain-containing protein [Actinobacillus equuli subsp. equuli]